ncbi:MAG: hypothetical protein K6U10_02225 [Acidobacteriia bacterium]|nr:hypothetical protein [Methyloceanibacter sp.]MCL6490618.1 hypothetical protein [Terriglobia bacterium]
MHRRPAPNITLCRKYRARLAHLVHFDIASTVLSGTTELGPGMKIGKPRARDL